MSKDFWVEHELENIISNLCGIFLKLYVRKVASNKTENWPKILFIYIYLNKYIYIKSKEFKAKNISQLSSYFMWRVICWIRASLRSDCPLNLVGWGPIICTSWGTSCEDMRQNLANAFRHLQTSVSWGLPPSTWRMAIVSSTATSSNTFKRFKEIKTYKTNKKFYLVWPLW